ncbi:DNA-deoxyinosine glycosylase [Bacteroides sedimenti]|uniref:DNA-deoxyinosine glycosylase n=1 Tax=Bacteroides sedimenti TaxID=2136147 RepID=A0ABN6Z2N2_9BACE
MISCFSPVVDNNTTRIVVGTMPSVDSLRFSEYYGNPRNQFWKILFSVFEDGRQPAGYEDKIATAQKHGVGLWDILASCKREGSLDSNIKDESFNDFPLLLQRYSNVRILIFNGQNSYKYFLKVHGQLPGVEYRVMPSTSPANAAKNFEAKLKEWKEALSF